jgi:hypothetical protein
MPLAIEGEPFPDEFKRKENLLYWGLIAPNVIFPLMELFLVPFWVNYFANKSSCAFVHILINVASVGVNLFQIISGIMLVSSVISIRDYLKQNNPDGIDTKKLVTHSGAFGLFLLCQLIYSASQILYTLNPTETTFTLWTLGSMLYYIGSLISQICLILIFWDLGKKESRKSKAKPNDSSLEMPLEEPNDEIEVEDWNEEDEVQSRIWNQFLRLQVPGAASMQVSAASVAQSCRPKSSSEITPSSIQN